VRSGNLNCICTLTGLWPELSPDVQLGSDAVISTNGSCVHFVQDINVKLRVFCANIFIQTTSVGVVELANGL